MTFLSCLPNHTHVYRDDDVTQKYFTLTVQYPEYYGFAAANSSLEVMGTRDVPEFSRVGMCSDMLHVRTGWVRTFRAAC